MNIVVDTIAAVSTAPGIGAISMVRISGSEAGAILLRLVPTRSGPPAARVATLVRLRDPRRGEVLDHALATWYPGPESFTGEDMVEFSCHGGRLVPELVLDACVAAGARRAGPGEFTQRAYLHGKLDLVQAEAIADVIEARSEALHRVALRQLERGLSERVEALRAGVLHLEALLAQHIDFPEEDDKPVELGVIVESAKGLVIRLGALLATAPEGELLREGALAVLAGRPNVGKSSLYNALLGEERALVTEVPGTTRDALPANVAMGGFPFRLVDTAGLRESDEIVERLGIEVTKGYLERADVVLLCVEAAGGVVEEEREFMARIEGPPVVMVETKGDLVDGGEALATEWPPRVAGHVRLSARTGEGLETLRTLLPTLVYSGLVGVAHDVPVLTRRRQIESMGSARTEVAAFATALASGVPVEVAAVHLRAAESALEAVVGVVAPDDVLDVLFREFCIGK